MHRKKIVLRKQTRTFALMLLLFSISVSAWSADAVGLAIGPTAMMKTEADIRRFGEYLDQLKAEDVVFGFDSRFRVGFLAGNLITAMSQGPDCTADSFQNRSRTSGDSEESSGESIGLRLESYLSVGLSQRIGFLQLGAYIGPRLDVYLHPAADEIDLNLDQLMESGLSARLTGDIILGPVSIGISYIAASAVSLNSLQDFSFNTIGEMFHPEVGRFGVSVLSRIL